MKQPKHVCTEPQWLLSTGRVQLADVMHSECLDAPHCSHAIGWCGGCSLGSAQTALVTRRWLARQAKWGGC